MDLGLLHILVIEESDEQRSRIEAYLSDGLEQPPRLTLAANFAEVRSGRRLDPVDLALLGLNPPPAGYAESLGEVGEIAPGAPVIVIAPPEEEAAALRAVATGAQDFLLDTELSVRSLWRCIRYVLGRSRAEKELGRRGTWLEAVVEGISDIVAVVDAEGTVVYESPSIERVLGYAPTEREGRSALDLIHPEDMEFSRRKMREAFARPGSVTQAEIRMQHKDGRWRFTEIRARNLIQNAAVGGLVVTIHDVTERRQSEEAARQAEQRFRALVEQSLVGICIIDDRSRIAYVNPRWTEIAGYPPDEAMGMSFEALLVEADQEMAFESMAAQLRGESRGMQFGTQLRDRDGRLHYVEVYGRRVELHGRPSIIAVLQDVTEKRKLQEEVLQARKMRAIGRLAGGVAHDFNNLLTSIGVSGELLRQRFPDDPETLADATAIVDAVVRGSALTRKLLMFSRKDPTQARKVSLDGVVVELEDLLRRALGAEVDLAVHGEAPDAWVEADPAHIEQVIMNLVINARDAMPAGGRIAVETTSDLERARSWNSDLVRDGDEGRCVYLSVSDTGEGIPQEVLPYIFEPFFTTKAPAKGTGLGLSTVYGIVTRYRGAIEVSSTPGSGTRFTISLPRVAPPVQAAVTRTDELPKGHERILLAEDDPVVRNVTRRILEHHGYRVVEAEDARAAISLFDSREEPFDLLFTDVVMPVVNGLDLAEELRRRDTHLRVLFMSGYAADEMIERVNGLGLDLLQKPFTAEALLRRVRSALEGTEGQKDPSPAGR